MGSLDGRVVIVTGGGRGLGRAHALLLAQEGAQLVVTDLPGTEGERGAAADVVDEIAALGGKAIAVAGDITQWETGRTLVETAVSQFGRLDGLVNNAGALRDQYLVNLTEDDWDFAINVNLRGTFVPTRWAAAYWRDQTKAGERVAASVVHTSSGSGLFGNPGQANYVAAKAGIGMFSKVCATELSRYGVRSNSIVPAARTRLTESAPGVGEIVAAPDDPGAFDEYDPANVSPVVAYLLTADCPLTAETLYVRGGHISVVDSWKHRAQLTQDARWTVAELSVQLPQLCESDPQA
ncbi:SDR family NAD(P)-dependent oxidoreductase [Nocardia sp. NPDC052278]|uniref:SDR family NAD(P)-dependent oxidoreductase n=1 Tax=unclassified Nocardia TaxID=2637762 RepID=UPI0036A14BA3